MHYQEVVLKHPLADKPVRDDFILVDRTLRAPDHPGSLMVENICLSLDPYIGSRLRGRHMGEPAPAPGQSMPGYSVLRVTHSDSADYQKGDWVLGEIGWASAGSIEAVKVLRLDSTQSAAAHLSVLGVPGLTAWAGTCELLKIQPGDIFTVDAASGPVGATAGQIAKSLGAKVVGIAGGREKCALATDYFGFDACVDRLAPDFPAQLKSACGPSGPSAHFENVGLSVLMPVMMQLALYGRVVLCGMIEHYHAAQPPMMPTGLIIGKRAQMLGLVVYDFEPRRQEWHALAKPLLANGTLKFLCDEAIGLESAPAHFERLMQGHNRGKCLIRLQAD